MIAKVRIAPVEQWCWWYENGKAHPLAQQLVGLEVEIETKSMRQAECNSEAKMWDISEQSNKQMEKIVGIKSDWYRNRGVCEHMLELGD